jgi:hypothetical protein
LDLIKSSAPYINQTDRYEVINALEIHTDKSPQKVGEILLEIFKHQITYDLSRGKVTRMVERLYKYGIKDVANRICLMHAEMGIDFLRKTYQKNNSQTTPKSKSDIE